MILEDEEFEVNFRDLFVDLRPNIADTWVERCDLHVRKSKEIRDRQVHDDLREDLVEHLWNLNHYFVIFISCLRTMFFIFMHFFN